MFAFHIVALVFFGICFLFNLAVVLVATKADEMTMRGMSIINMPFLILTLVYLCVNW